MTDVLVTGIGHLTTNQGNPVTSAAVATQSGRVIYAGPESDAPEQGTAQRIDCDGRAMIPGFVDAHTHLIFAGDRSAEFTRRMSGASYQEIAESGGGILSTVNATRAASLDQLLESATDRIRRMTAAGTTVVEIKSGYGLDLDSELRIIEAARRLREAHPITIKITFLGGHSVPEEFRSDRDGYISLVIDEMLPAVESLVDYCDVFVEEGVFSVDEARSILTAAASHGLGVRVHAEQLTHSGGAMLAAELHAASADHLDHATPEDAAALAEAGVTAVLVPGASYTLRTPQAPAPMLWDAGCVVALATDCNPGTSFLESMGLVISLAVVQMGLTPTQAVWAATRGGALSLGLADHGLITQGSIANMVILDAPTPDHIAYRPATNLVWRTINARQPV